MTSSGGSEGGVLGGFILAVFWALTLYAFVVRTIVQRLRSGDTGVRGVSRTRGTLAIVAGLLMVPAWLGLGAAATWRAFAQDSTTASLRPLADFLAVAGAVLGIVSQLALGRSWRIGVADGETTTFVAGGPFRWVRNPFFTGMLVLGAGTTAAFFTWAGAVALAALAVALSVQVRLVEEPHLCATFGEEYAAYARRTGRFVPRIGRSRR
jgi:protein-S-isoprenylcysteine O-methyltransferase Ste14